MLSEEPEGEQERLSKEMGFESSRKSFTHCLKRSLFTFKEKKIIQSTSTNISLPGLRQFNLKVWQALETYCDSLSNNQLQHKTAAYTQFSNLIL